MSSLLDLILGQKIILLTLGAAALLFLAALTLGALAYFRRARVRRAQRRAEEPVEAAEVPAFMRIDETPQAAAPAVRASAAAPPAPAAGSPAPPSTGTVPTKVVPTASVIAASGTPAAQTTAEQNSQQSAEVNPAMQDLLSSVFSDEESAARFAVLMQGIDPADMDQVAKLCEQITRQLHGEPA